MRRAIAGLIVLAWLSFWADKGAAQTVNFNDGSVVQSTTKRVGLNIGSINYYDTGQILKNLVGSLNPGFEPAISRQIWALDSNGTSTTFPIPDVYYSGVANYWAGGTFTVTESQSGGAELGCTGTIQASSGPSYPNEPVVTVSSACAAPFAIGDVVVLSNVASPTPESWWENDQAGLWNSSLNGGRLTSDTTDLCATCGTQALKMDATTAGSTAAATWYFDSAYTENLFVLMNGTFQISFWAKAAAQSPLITIKAQRFSNNDFNCGTITQTPTSAWTQYTFLCTASEQPSTATPANAYLTVSVAGGAIYFDNISFQKVNGDGNNTTVLRDEALSTLEKFYATSSGGNPGPFRYWLLQNAETMQNWTQPDYAHAPTVAGDKYYVGPAGTGQTQLSLEDYLIICKTIGAEPYLEVPVTFSSQDASGLIDFLAGPTGTTYGAQRNALGQATPWTSVFSTIHLSFCNECWNSLFGGQNLPYRANAPAGTTLYDYSSVAKVIFAAMRANPYYSHSSFDLVMNAQTGINYEMDAAIKRASPDSIELEDYMYSSVNDFATDSALWTPAMVEPWDTIVDPGDPSNFYLSVHDYAGQTTCGPNGTSVCKSNIYEWGPGTFAGSIDQQHMDYITAGGGQGVIAALLPLLNMQYYGIVNQSYFALTGFQNTASNNEIAKIWGNTVDMGGATNNVRPQFEALSLINQSIIGPMYSCPIANNPTFNFAGDSLNGASVPPGSFALTNVPLTYAFCFENGSNRSIVLINTDVTNSHALSFAGIDPPAGSVTMRQFAPSSLDSLNEAASGQLTNTTAASIINSSSTLSNPSSLTLPPYSVTALDYDVPLPGPSFSLPAGTYPPTQSVSLADPVAGTTIYYTTDGSTPTINNSMVYNPSSPISVSSTETISAIAVSSTLTSSVSTAHYSIFPLPATPVLSLAMGSYPYGTTLTLSDTTSGAVIYYTTDGSTPTTASTVYSGAIALNFTPSATPVTLKAIAVANTLSSPISSAQYTILQIPANLQFILLSYVTYGSGYGMTMDSLASPTPTGTVTVSINNQVYGSSSSWFQGKVAFYDTQATPANGWVLGPNTVTATFANDPIYQSQTLTQTVTFSQVTTTTSLAASNMNPMVGSAVTLTATVSDSKATGTVTFKDGTATIGTGTLSGGVATYTVAAIAAGPHSYTAVYSGNASDATSTSPAVVVSALAATTTALTATSVNPVAGTSVTLTATVSSTSATGTVAFMDGATALGSFTISSGVATYTVTAITSGAHSYTAAYSGDSTYATSTSAALPITAQIATANLLLVLTTSTAVYNSGFGVTVESLSGPTPSGPVTFKINNHVLQTVTSWFQGKNGYYETYALPSDGWVVGNNTVTAVFAGDSIYASQTLTQSVTFSLLPTTTTMTASNATPAVGSSVTLTTTVSPTASTGTVTFMDGTTSLGSTTVSSGVATYIISAIAIGTHNYTAVYNGDSTHATSTSSPLTISVLAATSTTLSASSTSPIAGTNVTLTAAILPTAATGTVTFFDGGTLLGSSVVSGGVAGYTIVGITAATHSYTAVYGGSPSYATSTSPAVTVTPLIASTTTISASNTAPAAGTSVTLTATLAPAAATGTVTFLDGATTLATGTVSGGVASYTVSGITVGSHTYSASYGGSTNYGASVSPPLVVTASGIAIINTTFNEYAAGHALNGTTPSTDIPGSTWNDANGDWTYYPSGGIVSNNSDLNTPTLINVNQPDYAAIFAYPAAGAILLFRYIDSYDYILVKTFAYGGITLYSATLTGGTTQLATIYTSTPAAPLTVTLSGSTVSISSGGQTVYATVPSTLLSGTQLGFLSPASNFVINSLNVAVSNILTTTTLTAPINPTVGANVTLTATTTPTAATGTVTFYDGTTSLGTGTISSGVATYPVTAIAPGTHSYTAVYAGNSNYSTSTSSALTVTPQAATTSTKLTAPTTTPTVGSNLTLTATLAPTTVTGTVTFYDGTTSLGTGTLVSGVASYTVSAIAAGTHSYTAVFAGNASFATSTSSVLTVTPQAAATTTSLTVPTTTPTVGTSVTLTATLAPTAATGTVTFYDGTTTLGTGTLVSGVATYTVSSIAAGTHNYTAVFAGNASFLTSSSSAVTVTPQAATTSTTLTTATTTPIVGTNVTLTATLTPTAATGTVTFYDGTTTLGTGTLAGGVVTYTVSAIAAGTHSYTAVYAGNASYATSTSAAVTVTAAAGSYLISTTFSEYAAGHALNGTAPATDTVGSTWSDPNGDWSFLSGGGIVSRGTDFNYPTLINVNTPNYSATFTYPAVNAVLLLRYVDLNNYLYIKTLSYGAVALYSEVGGTSTQLAILWISAPAAPLTVSLSGSTATISCNNATASANIPSTLLNATQLGFYAPSAGFVISSLSVTGGNQATATTTTLSASNTTPAVGASVTLTATLAPTAATGTVTFYDGTTTLGTGTLVSGVATYTVSSITAGSHSYTAVYGGNSSYATSASAVVTVATTTGTATTTTLSASNITPAVGASVTLTATLAPTAATGAVTFYDGTTSLGTGTLAGGVVTYTVSAIAAGTHSYTAVYAGNASYATSTSAAVTVTAAAGSYLISTTFSEYAAGHALNGTAPATDTVGSTWSDPNGDWSFLSGGGIVSRGTDFNYPTLINVNTPNYSATFTYPAVNAVLLLRYVDLNNYLYIKTLSYGAVALYSEVGGTSTQLAILWISAPAAPLTVSLSGSTATISCNNATASANIPSTLLNATQLGFYAPSAGFVISSLSVTGGNQATATTTTLSASNTTPAVGASVTLTATLAPTAATGTVTFYDGTTTLGTGTLVSGVATYTVSSITAGSHSYTAVYGGNSSYATSASAVVTVATTTGTATTTTLSASNITPAVGASVTLTATLAPTAATGAVTFYDGTTSLGTGTLAGGVVTYTVSAIAAGTHSYTAVYAGNASYATSTSAAVTVTAAAGSYLISTTFSEYAAGHALNGTAPATDTVGSTWSDPNGDWSFLSGGGIVSRGTDFNYPTLINVNTPNYSATFTYPAVNAVLLLRYVDLNNYLYIKTLSYGAVSLYSEVGGTSTQLAILWISAPAAPLTVSLSGSTATISCNNATASANIPSTLLNATQLGFYAPSAGFVISSLNVTGGS